MTSLRERVVVFPGSFDPLTLGHEDIVLRALLFADRVIVAVAHTASQAKHGMFGIAERLEMIREVFAGEARVEAVEFEGLVVEFARSVGARLIVRGVRSAADFEYEAQMARMNARLAPEIDTVLLPADPAHIYLSASLVREVARLGGDVSPFVSSSVERHLRAHAAG